MTRPGRSAGSRQGGAAMASKTTFTPEEWNRILESVVLSGMAVTAADPSGLFGVLKESMATGRTLLAAKADPTSNELIKSVVGDFETGGGSAGGPQPRDLGSRGCESAK